MDPDEFHLAVTGYSQVFQRTFTAVDSFLIMMASLNLTSSMPIVLFGYATFVGGPQAAIENWIVMGSLSIVVVLCLGEIAASLPTAGGLYFFSYRLGGKQHGLFLAWLTAWLSFSAWVVNVTAAIAISTHLLRSILAIHSPESSFVQNDAFRWGLGAITVAVVFSLNVLAKPSMTWVVRASCLTAVALILLYLIWIPVAVSQHHYFHTENLGTFNNWINTGNNSMATDGYCWMLGALFPGWIFTGFETSIHLAEETKRASQSVANSMYRGSLITYLVGIPVLFTLLLCIQDQTSLKTLGNRLGFAIFLQQILGDHGTTAVLLICWLDSLLLASIYFMSAQRLTWALARDQIMPYSFNIASIKNGVPLGAGVLVAACALILMAVTIAHTNALEVGFATATITQNLSYALVISARLTYGRKSFTRAKWNLGRLSIPCGIFAVCFTVYQFHVLILPYPFPVTATTMNFTPIAMTAILVWALGSWIAPKYGGRRRWQGPRPTITEEEVRQARLVARGRL